MKVTNNAKRLEGVQTETGMVYLKPDETRDLKLTDAGLKLAARLPYIGLEGVDRGSLMQSAPATPLANRTEVDDVPKSPAEVLAMFKDKDVEFLKARAEAKKILGDDMPSTKKSMIAALEALSNPQ